MDSASGCLFYFKRNTIQCLQHEKAVVFDSGTVDENIIRYFEYRT